MALDQFTNDPKFMALSPEAKAIVLSKQEGLSPEAAKIVISKIGGGPESSLKSLTRTFVREGLPFAGGLVGGIAGLPAGGPIGAVAGAGLGAAGMKAGGQAIEDFLLGPAPGEKSKGILERAGDVAMTGGTMAAGEASGPIIAKGIEKALPLVSKIPSLKIGGKAITEEGKAALSLAREKGLPLSASSVAPTKTAKAFEWIGESMPTGKWWATRKRTQLQEGLTRMMDETIESLPKRSETFDAGTALKQGIIKAKTALKGKEKTAYKEFAETLGTDDFSVRKTAETIEKIKDSYTGEARAWLEVYAKKGTEWKPADVDAFQGQIWKKLGKSDPHGGTLFKAFKQDLGNLSTMMLEKAKDEGKLLRTLSGSDTVKAILRKYSQDPEQAIRAAFRSGNLEDVQLLKKSLDAETWDIARSRFVENLFDASTDVTGTQRTFNPQKFADIFDKYKRQIHQVMPEKYDYLEKFASLSRASVSDLNKINMSDWTKAYQVGVGSAIGGGLATGNPVVLVPAGFSFAASKSIMNPKGWMKKWLTEGISMTPQGALKKGGGALKIGGRVAIAEKGMEE